MRIVRKGENGYDCDRRISNARIDYKPKAIAFCDSEQDVLDAIAKARAEHCGIRVRAGGHHHEGMCSGDDVWMIDVSSLRRIIVDADKSLVTVGAGARLGDIYDTVLPYGFIFPGGACRDVHVGGLVQGGGWGLFSRAAGLTCDSVAQFRMAIYDAKTDAFTMTTVKGAADDPNHDLFWAVCGGGGGNFGIATEFTFKVPPYKYGIGNQQRFITQFTMTWPDRRRMSDVLEEWLCFPDDDEYRLTTFCRLIAPGTEPIDQPTLIQGNFIGAKPELIENLKRLLPTTFSIGNFSCQTIATWPPDPRPAPRNFFTPAEYQAGPPQQDGVDLGNTCNGSFFRHKISSAYPVDNFDQTAGRYELVTRINATSLPNARRYVSLHSLGGVVRNDEDRNRDTWSSFAYRRKPFLIQYQAWWNTPDLDAKCCEWVNRFRDGMKLLTDGAFINFPDRDRVDTTDPVELMKEYYGDNFDRLRDIKTRYDPKKLFDFPMGIPRR
ncbi:MAG: FAD-binding oxidoreductase [Acidobacteria bacterium]|nr:FAD-binding oxidoreductase [Acidobacteriota bacterium]MBV9478820.1 FAD-binding oxidoreductase [Acidobacteriota bacterium]